MTIVCGVPVCNERPHLPMGGRFPGAESSIELGEGSSKIVGFEGHAEHEVVVGVGFDDDEYLDTERLGTLVARYPLASERQAIAAGRDDGEVDILHTDISDGQH